MSDEEGQQEEDNEWSEAHKVVLAIMRQRGQVGQGEVNRIWDALWQEHEAVMVEMDFSRDHKKGFHTMRGHINNVMRDYGFEIREDKVMDKQELMWFFVNTKDDEPARTFGAEGFFDAAELAYLQKIVETSLLEGPLENLDCKRLNTRLLPEGAKAPRRNLKVSEAERALDKFVAMGYLSRIGSDFQVGPRSLQDLKPYFTSTPPQMKAESEDLQLEFMWAQPR